MAQAVPFRWLYFKWIIPISAVLLIIYLFFFTLYTQREIRAYQVGNTYLTDKTGRTSNLLRESATSFDSVSNGESQRSPQNSPPPHGEPITPQNSTPPHGELITPQTSPPPHGEPIIFVANEFEGNVFPNIELCPLYNNCRVVKGYVNDLNSTSDLQKAHVVIFHRSYLGNLRLLPNLTWEVRSKQLWILRGLESPAFQPYKYPEWLNNHFNVTMSYRYDSDIKIGYQLYKLMKLSKPTQPTNYKLGKTKGALAFVSHCESRQYDRLGLMHSLAKYIDVDIYGKCGEEEPCGSGNYGCETKLYKQYHFYLSFENALCKDYYTEKFWERMKSKSNFVPVVMGGINQGEYDYDAPPHSFINVYDFDSVEQLGLYLKRLMENEEEYNSFHKWRESYLFHTSTTVRGQKFWECETCRLANTLPRMMPRRNLARWWNSACHNFTLE